MSCVQFELVAPRPDLRKRLRPAFVTELSRLRADDLPHDLPGNAEVSAYRLDRLTVDEVGATDLRNRLHDQHSNLGSHENGSQCGPSVPGSRLDADHPESGVLIPCRNTADSFPLGITAGPDANLWFTERVGNKIGRITPAGTITEFTIPTAN